MVKTRERIELTIGWAEWDRDSFVQVGDRAIPQRIDVTLPSTADKWPSLQMTIEVRDGAPHCTELTMRAHPEGREVRGVDIRAVRLEDWVDNVTSEAAMDVVTAEDGSMIFRRSLASVMNGGKAEQEFREARKAMRNARSGARRTVTDDLLRQVADIYRLNVTDRPVEAVQGAFGTSHRTAARYVQTARDKGFLPPTTRGKVSS